MKKISYIFLILLSVSALLLESCSKEFITKYPNDKIASDLALSDVPSMQTALNGVYAKLRTTSLFGRNIPIIGDLMADNSFVEVNNSGRYKDQFDYTITNSNSEFAGIWNNAYSAILYSNLIIDADVKGAEIDAIKSQALAIRALLYFKLVNTYARPYTDNPNGLGVPLILHYKPLLLPKRDTISKVYSQIISDLKTAFQTAPTYQNSVRISKYAIEGLLARAYFYMGDYANAKIAALDVINNSGFTLTNTAAAYKGFWNNPGIQVNKSEVMFEVDVDAVNNFASDDLGAIVNGGYTDIYATKQLVDLYKPTDIRRSVLIPGTTKSGATATLIGKYPNYKNTSDKDNLKVIRLAEMYLIAAESSLPANEVDARKYLNQLMAFRDPAFIGYSSTGSQLLQDIVTERRKELAFEGDRFYDLNRLKWAISRGTNAGSIPPKLTDIPYNEYRRIAPIPLGELQANENLKPQQNTGY